MKIFWLITAILLLSSCKGNVSVAQSNTDKQVDTSREYVANLPLVDNSQVAHYKVFLIGNSHTSGVGELLALLISNSSADKEVTVAQGVDTFLDVALYNEIIHEQIDNTQWSHVILQGQKYSQSQSRTYSTIETTQWIQLVKEKSATPILFPEHPQKGHSSEARYVHNIHLGIAKKEASCVAPVGITWDKVLAVQPHLKLHEADGNHATQLGKLLTALVLYEVVTGQPAELLPFIPELPTDEVTQSFLAKAASQVTAENENCFY